MNQDHEFKQMLWILVGLVIILGGFDLGLYVWGLQAHWWGWWLQ